MSVLEICQRAAKVVGVNPPTTLINSSNIMAQKLLEHLCAAAKERRRDKPWPQLIRTGIITLTAGEANPSMPGDIMGYMHNTFWDIDGGRPMEGPLNPSQWANIQWGIVNVGPFKKFRIAGRIATKRFEINPTPTSGDTGSQIGFLYSSKNWLIPAMWTTGTAYAAGSYVSNATGEIYVTTAGGTSGATIPTHTSGTVSDGAVQWAYYNDVYEEPMKDSDISLFDDELMELDVVWRLRKATGMDYTDHKAEADRLWSAYYVQSNGAPTIRICGVSDNSLLLSERNIPDTGYGL